MTAVCRYSQLEDQSQIGFVRVPYLQNHLFINRTCNYVIHICHILIVYYITPSSVNMNASEHEASSNLKLLSSTNGPLSNTMVSEATTNPEQDDQSLVGVRHTNGPRATDAAASAGTLQINQYNK